MNKIKEILDLVSRHGSVREDVGFSEANGDDFLCRSYAEKATFLFTEIEKLLKENIKEQ